MQDFNKKKMLLIAAGFPNYLIRRFSMKMNKKLKNIILPAIAVGMLIVGTNGLKEAVYSGNYADTIPAYYQPRTPSLTGASLNNQVRENYARNDLGPSLTFLVHGIGGNASNWSNGLYYSPEDPYSDELGIAGTDYDSTEPWNYKWNNGSLITKIMHRHDAAVYLAKYESNNKFSFYRFNEVYLNGKYVYQEVPASRNFLSETYKHNVIVYQSESPWQSLANEFAHFEHVVNTLSYDYQRFYGFNPKINLVGHSRGGLVVQSYVNKYPYNVEKYFNIATPYNGTQSLTILDTLLNNYGGYITSSDGNDLSLDDPAYNDLRNQSLLYGLKTQWNNIKQNSTLPLEGYDFGGVMTLPYMTRLISEACDQYNIPLDDSLISLFVGLFNELNDLCVTNYNSNTYITNTFMRYEDYNLACRDWLSSDTKNQMKDMIYDTIYDTAYELVAAPMVDSYTSEYEDIPFVGPVVNWLGDVIGRFGTSVILSSIRNQIIPILVDSITSFNGQVGVFNNDVLVDISSQMASGYWGQNRFVKIFDTNYLQPGIAKPTSRALLVGHNLETLDEDILEQIMSVADFPNRDELRYDIHTDEEANVTSAYSNIIASTVKKVTIDGSAFGNGTQSFNPYIRINNRSSQQPLIISVKNFRTSLNAESVNIGYPFIKYLGTSTFDLTIEYKGSNYVSYSSGFTRGSPVSVIDCGNANIAFNPLEPTASLSLTGAKGSNGVAGTSYNNAARYEVDEDRNGYSGYNGGEGTYGRDGSNCVVCRNLDLRYAKNLTLKGGQGGNGGNGGHGGRGADGKTKALGFKGGDGGKGGNGGRGGRGGNGGYAFSCYNLTMGSADYLNDNINLYPGKPGNGGRGGKGGDGGNGANGSYFQILWSVTNHNGGNGGNGGLVGYGGDSGYSIFDGATYFDLRTNNQTKYNAMKARCGSYLSADGGLGGSKFGNGGNAGRRSKTNQDNTNPVTGDGTPGKAVTSYNQINGLYRECSTLLTTSYNGQSYFITNGLGRDNNGSEKYYSTQPTYGRNGILNYYYNE